jgi:hypothetical protein
MYGEYVSFRFVTLLEVISASIPFSDILAGLKFKMAIHYILPHSPCCICMNHKEEQWNDRSFTATTTTTTIIIIIIIIMTKSVVKSPDSFSCTEKLEHKFCLRQKT